MTAYVRLQEAEFAAEADGYTATRHQREVGTGYFDLVTSAISPNAETVALAGSTESRAVPRRVKPPRSPARTAHRKTGKAREMPVAGSGGVVGR